MQSITPAPAYNMPAPPACADCGKQDGTVERFEDDHGATVWAHWPGCQPPAWCRRCDDWTAYGEVHECSGDRPVNVPLWTWN